MTLRTFVFACIATATWLGPSRPAALTEGAPGVSVELTAPAETTVGVSTSIGCSGTDPEGIRRIAIRVISPFGVSTVLGAAFGVSTATVDWVPAGPGEYRVRCRVDGASGPDADATETSFVMVHRAPAPVAESTPPPAPAPTGTASLAPPPEIGAAVFQDGLRARMLGPRKLAVTPEGQVFVADAVGRLHRLTARGEFVATLIDGVTAIAAGPGALFVAQQMGVVVQVQPLTGRVVGRFELGISEPVAGMAYDAVRDTLWMAFGSGVLHARRPDGTPVHAIVAAGPELLVRLVDVAVDPAGVVWVAQDRSISGGMIHGFDAGTGEYLRSIGSSAAGQVRIVGGLAFGGNHLYVSDIFSGYVQVLDGAGAVLDVIGTRGSEAGQLRLPVGLAFLGNGDLLVANMDLDRVERFGSGVGLPVCAGDSDCDGLSDEWEIANGFDPQDPQNAMTDVDGDGLNESEEYAYHSSPRAADTDGDGYTDFDEVLAGYNPADGKDHRPVMVVDVPELADPGLVLLPGSFDDRGRLGSCSVAWRQLVGAPVELRSANSLTASFVARSGTYRFEAVATCSGAASLPAMIDVTIRNLPPRADGGSLIAVPAGKRVRLGPGETSDPNGDRMAFVWDQLYGVPVIGTIEQRSIAVLLATPGYYSFRLGAVDTHGEEGAAEVPVLAIGPQGAPTAIVSTPLLARAGERVVLDGSASYRTAAATFWWHQVGGTGVEVEAADAEVAAFVAPAPGRYTFELSVSEPAFRSPPATVDVFVAPADGALPVARAAAPAVVAVNVPVTLDAGGSTAGSGQALTYGWRQVAGPAAGLTQADRAAATVVVFEPGSFEFELVVGDEAAVSVPARVRFDARAGGVPIPVAVASARGTAIVGELVSLDGSASIGAFAYRWSQVEGPWVPITQGAQATFVPTGPGVYGFELQVDGGGVRSAPARVTVMVFPNATEN